MRLLAITPKPGPDGVLAFTLRLQGVTGAAFDVSVSAAELLDYRTTQRIILERTGEVWASSVADDKPHPYDGWQWRAVVEVLLDDYARDAAKAGSNPNVN